MRADTPPKNSSFNAAAGNLQNVNKVLFISPATYQTDTNCLFLASYPSVATTEHLKNRMYEKLN
ncbi:MAG: hypothetical protein V4590_09035 [Bacteroidota bacterium]